MSRHKTDWERVIAAIDSIVGNDEAVEVLRQELMPKYEAVVAKRDKVRDAVYAYRATARGKAKAAEYAKEYRKKNHEKCNKASRECHRRKRAAMKTGSEVMRKQ